MREAVRLVVLITAWPVTFDKGCYRAPKGRNGSRRSRFDIELWRERLSAAPRRCALLAAAPSENPLAQVRQGIVGGQIVNPLG